MRGWWTDARRLHRLVAGLAVAVLLCGAATGYLWYQRRASQARATAERACLSEAGAAAQAIFSYDYRSFDASVAAARRHLTGTFATEYAKTTASLRDTATRQRAVVQAQVSAVGVVSTTAHTVTVLVYLNQYRRNASIAGEKLDQSRVVLTLVRVGDGWKVRAAAAL